MGAGPGARPSWPFRGLAGPAIPALSDQASVDVSNCSVSPDGSTVLTTSFDENARLWNVATGASIPLADKLTGLVQFMAWSADGRRVVVANGPVRGF